MIQLENLTKVYRTYEVETTSLQEVTLEVAQGEFVAVMGPSGCGKSTLLNIVGMLDSPTSGSYRFAGSEVAHLGERQRAALRKANIGFIFQSFNLIDELTVYENIELPLLYLKLSAAERKQRVTQLMDKLQIGHRKKHFPQQLSGGQQQRVAVARALAIQPRLILADEPTGNLDSKNGEEVMRLLAELNREGTTIIMVTHSQEHAAYAGRIVHLFDGRVMAQNSPQHQPQV